MSPTKAIQEVRYVADGISNALDGDPDAMRWVRRLRKAADTMDTSHRKSVEQHRRARILHHRRLAETSVRKRDSE
jgi:hypothetical protein